MTISLPQELETLIAEKVRSGRYDSAGEVVREGLRLLDDMDRLREIRRDELRRDLQKGIDDLREGRYKEFKTEQELRDHAQVIIERGKENLAAERKAG